MTIPQTNIMRFGPVGLMGTLAPLITVKAGVFSCTLAFACCNWVLKWPSRPCYFVFEGEIDGPSARKETDDKSAHRHDNL